MKKRNLFKVIGIATMLSATALALTSCADFLKQLFDLVTTELGFTEEYDPDEFATTVQENGEYSKFNYQQLFEANHDAITPGKGTVNILVVPVQWSDLTSFTSNDLSAINAAFNGTKEDNTNDYWESVKSFYYKSSNGILNFNFTVSDVYVPTYRSSVFLSQVDDYGTESSTLLDEIESRGVKVKGSRVNFKDSKWDSNNDKYMDGIWMIYNEKNSAKVDTTHFWAYVTNYYGENTNSSLGRYGNCALSFLYEDSSKGHDAHTLIHESGHMLGLDDYYDYNNPDNDYSFDGGLNMMNLNIGDHDSYSKYSLGWTKSLVVNESKTYTLKPFEESFDSLIIPSGSYNGSCFSEYYLIEFYTPTGLFKLDATRNYRLQYPKFFGQKGLRIRHIDARLAMVNYNGTTFNFENYLSSSITKIPEISGTSSYIRYPVVAHSNSLNDKNRNKDRKPLIELASRTQTRLYQNRYANDLDLYKKGDTINASSLSETLSSGKFNDGSSFSAQITVDDITDEAATLTISL